MIENAIGWVSGIRLRQFVIYLAGYCSIRGGVCANCMDLVICSSPLMNCMVGCFFQDTGRSYGQLCYVRASILGYIEVRCTFFWQVSLGIVAGSLFRYFCVGDSL